MKLIVIFGAVLFLAIIARTAFSDGRGVVPAQVPVLIANINALQGILLGGAP